MKDQSDRELQLGDIVFIPLFSFFRHYGVVIQEASTWCEPIIRTVSYSQNAPFNHTQSEFSGEVKISILPYPSQTPRWKVAQNALETETFEYGLLANNCENFCRRVHGLNDISIQVIAGGLLLIASFAVMLIAKKPIPVT